MNSPTQKKFYLTLVSALSLGLIAQNINVSDQLVAGFIPGMNLSESLYLSGISST